MVRTQWIVQDLRSGSVLIHGNAKVSQNINLKAVKLSISGNVCFIFLSETFERYLAFL